MKVLLVEDDSIDAEIIREILETEKKDRLTIEWVDCLESALSQLDLEAWDIALLDLSLPDCDGLSSVARLQASAPSLPIIVLTSLEDEEMALKAVQAGVQDYVFKKDLESAVLVRMMRYAIERQRLKGKLEKAQMQLTQAERSKVVAQTASAAAHEIYNPLSVISAYAEMMLRDIPADGTYRGKLEEIYQATRDIDAIIKKMSTARTYALGATQESKDTMVDFSKASQ